MDRYEPELTSPAWEGFRLSRQQDRLWTLQSGGSAPAAMAGASLHGVLDEAAFAAAATDLIERHEILRTSVKPVLGGASSALMVINPPYPAQIGQLDLRALDEAEQESRIADFIHSQREAPADPATPHPVRFTLFRRGETHHVLIVTATRYVLDPASGINLIEALAQGYAARAGRAAEAESSLVQYPDFAQWQHDSREEQSGTGLFSGWRQAAREAPPLRLPLEYATRRRQTAELRWTVPAATTAALAKLASERNTELRIVVQACWHAALWQIGGRPERLVVETGFPGRPFAELDKAIGAFESHGPIVQEVPAAATLDALILSLADLHGRALADADSLPLVPEANPSQSLPHLGFSWTEQPDRIDAGGLAVSEIWSEAPGEPFKLELDAVAEGGILRLAVRHEVDGFAEAGIEAVAGALRAMIDAAARSPEALVDEVEILAPEVAEASIAQWNPPAPTLGLPDCWHRAFTECAARTPDAPALSFESRDWSYGELDRFTNRMARALRRRGVTRGDRVALLLERSDLAIATMIAVAKAGAAFVPIDPLLPARRREVILAKVEPRLLVTETESNPRDCGVAERLLVDADRAQIEAEEDLPVEDEVAGSDLAYVMFTSGSTGAPKGVAIEHRQLVHYVDGVVQRLAVHGPARYIALGTIATDLGNTAIFPALCTGGSLDIVPMSISSDAQALTSYLAQRRYDVMKITPSHLAALFAIADAPAGLMPSQALVLGGEALSWGWLRLFRSFATCRIFNHYGPTETCVGVLCGEIVSDELGTLASTAPLGRPLAHARAYIVDGRGRPVPLGVSGELWIGGETVARGYLDNEAETEKRFAEDPWAVRSGGRIYRTGDHVRQLPDGTIEFLGRIDRQVKVRGFRVELGEIEAVLRQHEQVKASLVIEAGESGSAHLAAYVIAADGSSGMADWLRPYLEERLPDFMVPPDIVSLARFPLTAAGKVDVSLLPDPAALRAATRTGFTEPRTDTERAVAAIFADLLLAEQVGAEDDFFDIGGHSLLATRLLARLRSTFPVNIGLRTVFEDATVAGLAAAIDSKLAREAA